MSADNYTISCSSFAISWVNITMPWTNAAISWVKYYHIWPEDYHVWSQYYQALSQCCETRNQTCLCCRKGPKRYITQFKFYLSTYLPTYKVNERNQNYNQTGRQLVCSSSIKLYLNALHTTIQFKLYVGV